MKPFLYLKLLTSKGVPLELSFLKTLDLLIWHFCFRKDNFLDPVKRDCSVPWIGEMERALLLRVRELMRPNAASTVPSLRVWTSWSTVSDYFFEWFARTSIARFQQRENFLTALPASSDFHVIANTKCSCKCHTGLFFQRGLAVQMYNSIIAYNS